MAVKTLVSAYYIETKKSPMKLDKRQMAMFILFRSALSIPLYSLNDRGDRTGAINNITERDRALIRCKTSRSNVYNTYLRTKITKTTVKFKRQAIMGVLMLTHEIERNQEDLFSTLFDCKKISRKKKVYLVIIVNKILTY